MRFSLRIPCLLTLAASISFAVLHSYLNDNKKIREAHLKLKVAAACTNQQHSITFLDSGERVLSECYEQYVDDIPTCAAAIECDPAFVLGYHLRAKGYLALQKWNLALADCRTALRLIQNEAIPSVTHDELLTLKLEIEQKR